MLGYSALVGGVLVIAASLTGANAEAQVYRCSMQGGHVEFRDKPCEGQFAGIAVPIPANDTLPGVSRSVTVPKKAPAVVAPQAGALSPAIEAADAIPPDIFAYAGKRLTFPSQSGHGLSKGMMPAAVIAVWGRPHNIDASHGRGRAMWFEYCDNRVALFWNGALVAWGALFEDSRRGVATFPYGDSWKTAATKWGYRREFTPHSFSGGERSEVQSWSPSRWIVTNAQGGIVSWCDADGVPQWGPPLRMTAWER